MRILLVCNAGMSTSLIVEKMKQKAPEDVKIEAHPVTYLAEHIREWDVILIGPQIRYKEREISKLCSEHGKVCGVIDMMDYGQGNGESIFEYALKLYKEQYE